MAVWRNSIGFLSGLHESNSEVSTRGTTSSGSAVAAAPPDCVVAAAFEEAAAAVEESEDGAADSVEVDAGTEVVDGDCGAFFDFEVAIEDSSAFEMN